MKAKIDTDQGKQIYARRLGIVEPVFANICVQKCMNCFTLRSKIKIDVQWRLFALVHNIGKIHTFVTLILALTEQKKRKTAFGTSKQSLRGILDGEALCKIVFSTVSLGGQSKEL